MATNPLENEAVFPSSSPPPPGGASNLEERPTYQTASGKGPVQSGTVSTTSNPAGFSASGAVNVTATGEIANTMEQIMDEVHPTTFPDWFFEMEAHRLWYDNPEAEAAFLEFQMESCGFRMVGLCFGFSIVAFVRVFNTVSTFTMIVAGVIGGYTFAAAVADVILLFLLKRAKQFEATQLRTLNRQQRAMLRRSLNPVDDDAQFPEVEEENLEADRPTCSRTLLIAQFHEFVAVITTLANVVGFVLIYAFQQDTCAYIFKYDDRDDHELCPYRMQMFWYFVSMFPILIGTPRFFYVVALNIVRMILTGMLLRFHDTSDEVTGMVYTIQAAFLVFVCALKWMNEHQERVRFQAKWTLQFQTLQLRRKSEAVKQLVFSTTPLHLRSRLTSSAFKLQVDIAHEAVCLLVDIFEVQKFMTSMLPVASANAIAKFNARLLVNVVEYPLAHVRTIGDANYFVANLFDSQSGATSSSSRKQQHSTTSSQQSDQSQPPLSPAKYIEQAILFTVAMGSKTKLILRAGIGAGFLIGSPVGHDFVRYDIFGPALKDAHDIIATCGARNVKLSETAINMLKREQEEGDEDSVASQPVVNTHQMLNEDASSVEGHRSRGGASSRVSSAYSDELVDLNAIRSTRQIALKVECPSDHPSHGATGDASQTQTVVVEHKELALNTCCMIESFVSEETKETSGRQQRAQHLNAAFVTLGFYTLFFSLLLVTVVVDRASTVDTPLTIAFVLLALAVVGSGILAVVLWRRTEPHTEATIFTTRVICVLAFCGAQLSRSSIIGDDCGYLLYFLQISQLSLGGSTLATLVYQLLLTGLYYAFMAFRPLVDTPQLMLVLPSSLPIMYCCVMYNNREKEHFVQLAKVVTTHAEVRAQEQIRQSMLDALVPSTLRWRVTPETIKASRVDSWGVDDCVVLAFGLHYNTEQFNEWVSVPQKIRDFNSKTLGLIEDLVGEVPHGRLKTVSMFGGNILAAGPLEDADSANRPEEKLKRSNSIDEALEDTVVFLANFLKDVTCVDYSGGVTVEQVINLLRLTSSPSFDLLGPAVSTAQAIQAEAPTKNMIVMTEKCATFVADRCGAALRHTQLKLSKGESWRVRHFGNIRISRVTLRGEDTHEHSTTASEKQLNLSSARSPSGSTLEGGGPSSSAGTTTAGKESKEHLASSEFIFSPVDSTSAGGSVHTEV